MYVAPLTGAWIETAKTTLRQSFRRVAPLTGAWIETLLLTQSVRLVAVAPLTGAWIETYCGHSLTNLGESHPSRVRGLKLRSRV